MSAWYRNGTVSVTNGSSAVTGVLTAWLSQAKPGDPFNGPDGRRYEIVTVPSDTSLTIVPAYVGSTASGQAYSTERGAAWNSTSSLSVTMAETAEAFKRGFSTASATPITIGAGTHVFTVASGLPILPGARLIFQSRAGVGAGTHWLNGRVTAYEGQTLTIVAETWANAGDARSDWDVNVCGVRGPLGGNVAVTPGAPGNLATWASGGGLQDGGVPTGWGAADTPQMAGIELGHATDTTLTRAAAGQLQVEGSRVFQRNNILGAVAQSGGVPTGAIIETGSNANGAYVRFASGLQICQYEFIGAPTVATLWVRSTPAEFYDSPTIVGAENQYVDVTRRFNFSFGSAGSEVYLYSATADDLDYPVRCVAMGRWF